jgi:hypothetical protein
MNILLQYLERYNSESYSAADIKQGRRLYTCRVSKKTAMEIQQAVAHHKLNLAKHFNFYIGRKS